jgi:hypothetical protein
LEIIFLSAFWKTGTDLFSECFTSRVAYHKRKNAMVDGKVVNEITWIDFHPFNPSKLLWTTAYGHICVFDMVKGCLEAVSPIQLS